MVIRVPKPLPPANQRLMDTLDVRVVIDPAAPAKCPCGCATGHYKQGKLA